MESKETFYTYYYRGLNIPTTIPIVLYSFVKWLWTIYQLQFVYDGKDNNKNNCKSHLRDNSEALYVRTKGKRGWVKNPI